MENFDYSIIFFKSSLCSLITRRRKEKECEEKLKIAQGNDFTRGKYLCNSGLAWLRGK